MTNQQIHIYSGPRAVAPRATPFKYTPLPSTAQFLGKIMKDLATAQFVANTLEYLEKKCYVLKTLGKLLS